MTCKLSLPRISSQKGKDYWKEVEKKEKKGLWGDWSMRVADGWPDTLVFLPQNSCDSENLDFLSRKLRWLPEFGFLVLKTQRMDALSQTQSKVSFLDTCKKQNFKKPCTLQGFVEISYYQNYWNFGGCCCTLTTKFELIIAVRPLCSSFLLSFAGSFVWTEKVEVI